jgi:hypothetical protein
MNEHIIIKDDKGKKHIFHNLKELVEYLDSFKMSFLPDNFNYEIVKEKPTTADTTIRKYIKGIDIEVISNKEISIAIDNWHIFIDNTEKERKITSSDIF